MGPTLVIALVAGSVRPLLKPILLSFYRGITDFRAQIMWPTRLDQRRDLCRPKPDRADANRYNLGSCVDGVMALRSRRVGAVLSVKYL